MATFGAKLPADWQSYFDDYELLAGRKLSPRTLQSYRDALAYLGRFLEPEVPPLADLNKRQVAAWLDFTVRSTSAATGALRLRSLAAIINFLADPGEDDEPFIPRNPVKGLRPPKVEEDPVPVLSVDQVKRVLSTCKGPGFEARRDEAIVRMLYDTGVRRGELVSMTLAGLDLRQGTALVHGKTGPRIIAFGPSTGAAIHRYLRLRQQRAPRSEQGLWIGRTGRPLAGNGVFQVLRRRFDQAGLEVQSAVHAWRHTAAHEHMARGGSLDGLVASMGWKSPSMSFRYAKSAAAERAREEHQRLAWAEKV